MKAAVLALGILGPKAIWGLTSVVSNVPGTEEFHFPERRGMCKAAKKHVQMVTVSLTWRGVYGFWRPVCSIHKSPNHLNPKPTCKTANKMEP